MSITLKQVTKDHREDTITQHDINIRSLYTFSLVIVYTVDRSIGMYCYY